VLILETSYYHVICYKTHIVTRTEKGIKNYINQPINQSIRNTRQLRKRYTTSQFLGSGLKIGRKHQAKI
jgi:hypothetical protein